MPRATVDTENYRLSHRVDPHPDREGCWIFRSLDTGEMVEMTGPYDTVVDDLDIAQAWEVMP